MHRVFQKRYQFQPGRLTDGLDRLTLIAQNDAFMAIPRDINDLGNKGETIKAIGLAARLELVAFLEHPVHLFLQVKVRPNWLEEPERYSEMGLDFKDGN